ncbi:hypothetical protein [Haloferax larsenii]|nr:hypothetical protein [Haloferax larsenii]
MTTDGDKRFSQVADIAEVTEERVQVVYLDGSREMVDGYIFAVFEGAWQMWLDTGSGILRVDPAEGPILTLPFTSDSDLIKFQYDGLKRSHGGRIKRLKRSDL